MPPQPLREREAMRPVAADQAFGVQFREGRPQLFACRSGALTRRVPETSHAPVIVGQDEAVQQRELCGHGEARESLRDGLLSFGGHGRAPLTTLPKAEAFRWQRLLQ